MWFFDEEKLLLLHYKLIDRFGGSHGLRGLNLIKSVLETPKTNYYRTHFDKAAVYARNIIGDHPFVDGNKRTGITAAIIFLEKNDTQLDFTEGELEDFAVKIANQKLEIAAISKWLESKASTIN
jgi:death-on-curing protein